MKIESMIWRTLIILGITLSLIGATIKISAAKGTFSRITIKSLDSGQEIIVTAPAYAGFFAFSDMVEGVSQAPENLVTGYEITRWYKTEDGKSYQPFDRLRWYPATGTATQGRGWIYYEGLINGSSEYDRKWFVGTRNGDILLQEATILLSKEAVTDVDSQQPPAAATSSANDSAEMETASQLPSPDHNWLAEVRWPKGENSLPKVEVRISSRDGSSSWIPISEQRAVSIAGAIPRFVRWSNDGRYLYVSKELSANGCASFREFNGLRRIDMLTRQVTEYFDQSVTLAVSTDDRWVAYIKGEPQFDGVSQLFLLDLSTNEIQLVLLDLPSTFITLGAIVWSPVSGAFALTATDDLCAFTHPKRLIAQVTVPDLTVTTLFKTEELSVQTADWLVSDKIRLVTLEGNQYDLTVPSSQMVKISLPDVFVRNLTSSLNIELKGIVWERKSDVSVAQTLPHEVPANFCFPYNVRFWIDYSCAQRIEAFQFEEGVNGVAHHDGDLSLETAKGRINFVDQKGEGGVHYESYSYLGWLPSLKQYLVSVHFYEAGLYLLVDSETGEITQLPAIPAVNESGTRMAVIPSAGDLPDLSIFLWRIDPTKQPKIQPDRLISIQNKENFNSADRTSLYWLSNDQLNLDLVYNWRQSGAHITMDVAESDVVIKINNDEPTRPAIRLSDFYNPVDAIQRVDTASLGKRIYNDRDYTFTNLSSELDGQPYFLFNNSNMHATAADYATFYLYRPATLYVAIDDQACALPGWMADWKPSDATLFTTDIGMKLYKKDFPEGDVTLGGNEMSPSACIRSHYLLFVVHPEDKTLN